MDFTPRSLEDLAHEFPPDLQHLSATGMKTAMRCAEQYRRIYIKGERKPPSLALVAGRADHKAIEASMRQKITSYEDLPVDDVKGVFLDTLETDVEQAGGLGELEDQPTTQEFDQVRSVGIDGVAKYHKAVSPKLQPTFVEEEFSLDLPGVPVPLIGYLDLVVEDAHNILPRTRIVDRKRSKRQQRQVSPEWAFQGRVYQLYRPLPHEWHVTVTGGRVAVVDATSLMIDAPDRSDQIARQVAMMAAQIGSLYQKFGPDDPWPANGLTHPFACNYCGFRDSCWAWKGVTL